MLKWRSKIEGNAAQARQSARKIVQPELEKLDLLVAELLNGGDCAVYTQQEKRTISPMLFVR